MTDKLSDDALININRLRKTLEQLMKPEVLSAFADLLEEIGKGGESSLPAKYEFFSKNSTEGTKCRYSKMAKHYFLEQHGDSVVELIRWLYNNFAKEC